MFERKVASTWEDLGTTPQKKRKKEIMERRKRVRGRKKKKKKRNIKCRLYNHGLE